LSVTRLALPLLIRHAAGAACHLLHCVEKGLVVERAPLRLRRGCPQRSWGRVRTLRRVRTLTSPPASPQATCAATARSSCRPGP
jgi:hypothetical protein